MSGTTKIYNYFPEDMDFKETNPFSSKKFLHHLEENKCVEDRTGWRPNHFVREKAILPGYIKNHSYGEYIFDWGWANLYEQFNENYYPKLIHMVPFSPVNSPKVLNASEHEKKLIMEDSFQWYQKEEITGQHYLFTDEHEVYLKDLGFCHYKTLQYHFKNEYKHFDDFLSRLKKSRRKMIKKEREKITNSDLEITYIEGDKIKFEDLQDLYLLYISTISKKGSYPYLTQNFFTNLLNIGAEKILLTKASKDQKTVAMALFLKSDKTLYGRYWGIRPEFANQYPGLHFELCYYQGIEYCIIKNIPLFEAGAQGEHKLLRGFQPTQINSYHHLKIPELFNVLKKEIERQNTLNGHYIEKLKSYLPFK